MSNQLYGKLIRILVSGDGEEIHIILGDRESKVPLNSIKAIEAIFVAKDVIVSFQELIRNKNKVIK